MLLVGGGFLKGRLLVPQEGRLLNVGGLAVVPREGGLLILHYGNSILVRVLLHREGQRVIDPPCDQERGGGRQPEEEADRHGDEEDGDQDQEGNSDPEQSPGNRSDRGDEQSSDHERGEDCERGEGQEDLECNEALELSLAGGC